MTDSCSTDEFNYLVDKISSADFQVNPFKHIEIENFLSAAHLQEILSSAEISPQPFQSDEDLFDGLAQAGYSIVPFPGAITNKTEYIARHAKGRKVTGTHSACESSGVVFRLRDPKTPILLRLKAFIESEAFNRALANKFDIEFNHTRSDGGIQKYLDDYEISPHPDLRKKALTFMVNINPAPDSESQNHHTHYLKFSDSRAYVSEYWKGNPLVERCWVPWDWCTTVKQQTKNNSIVIFAPSYDTLHGVKAKYDHLHYQRTQLYGNLWYEAHFTPSPTRLDWEDFVLTQKKKGVLEQVMQSALKAMEKLRFQDNKANIDRSRSDRY